MPTAILGTKLYLPPPRPDAVLRTRLIDRLSEGLHGKLILVSAPAGFGKTTLVSAWVAGCGRPAAWLSLDAGDNDPARFLTYLVAALQMVALKIGEGIPSRLQSSQPPSIESILTTLLNEIAGIPEDFVLVLDDYHAVDAKPADTLASVDDALGFLLEHSPPQMHLVVATREDPHLPLARLRARGQLTELRAADLRFTPAEAADFLNQVMGLGLSPESIDALEARTEGWIAGLQLAALALQGLSVQGQPDVAGFIKSFTGSHRFVLDYLVEEVLQKQSETVQGFLLRTSILDRMCAPLCEAVLQGDESSTLPASAQETLEYLERANLFVVPLDGNRRWYRYHHLFADLLRQRLHALDAQQSDRVAQYHIRASQWYADNGLAIEAFRHAVAANDIERAERLIQGGEIPLHSLAAVTAILGWLDSLPRTLLDARPWLWVRSATASLMAGQTTGVEEKLQAAEAALASSTPEARADDKVRDVLGQIASVRATLAILRYEPSTGVVEARRALEYLPPDDVPARGRALWALAFAHQLLGDRAVARRVYRQAMAIRQTYGNIYHTALATTGLAQIQESDNQLREAAETYRRSLQILSDQGPPNASEEYLGLARISYEWNDLDAAEQHAQQSLQMARQYDPAVDRWIISQVFLARVKLARDDLAGAAALLAEAEQAARTRRFLPRLPEIAAVQVDLHLRQGNIAGAAQLARQDGPPLSQARVLLTQRDPWGALAVLEPLRREAEARDWADQRLRTIVLQALALQLCGEKEQAAQALGEALALAEPGGFIRLFLDEGEPMRSLLLDVRHRIDKQSPGCHNPHMEYLDRLLAGFGQPGDLPSSGIRSGPGGPGSASVEPLTQRELEILRLIAQGLSNQEIGARLFLALNTIKGHNRVIFDKLQVQNRTEAIARARELGLL